METKCWGTASLFGSRAPALFEPSYMSVSGMPRVAKSHVPCNLLGAALASEEAIILLLGHLGSDLCA